MNTTLVKLRKDKHMTQEDIAADLSISRAYYGMIEKNQRNPSLAVAKQIADYFGVGVDDVFFNDNCNDMRLTS